jgi:hypothetical protein
MNAAPPGALVLPMLGGQGSPKLKSVTATPSAPHPQPQAEPTGPSADSWQYKGVPYGFGESPQKAGPDWQKVVLDDKVTWPLNQKVSLDEIAMWVKQQVPEAIGFTRHPSFDTGMRFHRKVTAFVGTQGEPVKQKTGKVRWPLFIYH